MLKIGRFVDNTNNDTFYVVINTVQNRGERIELYERIEDYNILNTYNAISAYYRKVREYVFGNYDYIRAYLKTYDKCVRIKGEIKQTTDFTEEGFVITETKYNEQLGLRYFVKMVNGLVKEEEYTSNEYSIFIDSISEEKSTVFVEPINLQYYKIISILSDFTDDSVADADFYSLEQLQAMYSIDHINNYDYVVVSDYETAVERLEAWKNARVKLKAVDIESTGLEVSIFGEDLITGVVLSYDWEPLGEIENSTYFPFRQKNFDYNLPIEFLSEIADAINSQKKSDSFDYHDYDGTLILAHNGKMERKSFWQDKLDIRVDVDTYTLSTLIDTVMRKGLHTLKNRAKEATGLFWLELDDIFKSKVIRFDVLPPEIVRHYACPDTANTIKVFKYLFKMLPPSEYAVFEIENAVQRCKSINEYYGLRLDQDKLIDSLKNVEYVVDTLSTIFKKLHKTSKNINSADVLRNIVYGQLKCDVVVRTKKNKPSTSAEAIKNIIDHGFKTDVDLEHDVPSDIVDLYGNKVVSGKDLKKNKYPSLVILAAYNKYRKELSALKRLQKKSIKNRVMFGINATGASSGRQTSDAHQYSDTMKSLVLSDTPEHVLISCDYSQVELRVLAYIIQDHRLIEMMKDKHIDIHRAFLSTINGTPVHMISASDRYKGKRVNFGVVYGISEFGLANQLYGAGYTKEQRLECSKAITDFYNGIPGCKVLSSYNRKFVFEHGYIETKFGYRRKFPNALDPDLTNRQRASIFRAANNTPIQGFAAHLMKQAEINYDNYIKMKGWDKTITYMDREFPLVRVMLSIHDEVLISAHKSIPREEIVLMCKKCMEISITDAPPFFAVPAFVDNWYQGKSDEFEMPISMRDDILASWNNDHKSIVDWNNLTQEIKDYKLREIQNYMNGLIAKYHTVEEVIKHVDHPEYTHLLISIYVTKEQSKQHSHAECIGLAVENYMSNNIDVFSMNNVGNDVDIKDDESVRDAMSYLTEIEEYVDITVEGDIVDVDVDDVVEEDDNSYMDKYFQENEEKFSYTNTDVVYLGNIVLVDTSSISSKENLHKFHQDVLHLCTNDGYYQLNYMRGKAMMPTHYHIDFAQKEIIEILNKYRS